MQAVRVDDAGRLDVKHVPRPEPKDGQLLIRVAATALNRADLLQVNHKSCQYLCPGQTEPY